MLIPSQINQIPNQPFFSSDVVSKAKVTSRGSTMGFSLAFLIRGQVSGNQSSPSAKMADVGTTPKCTLCCRQSCSSGARHSVKTLEQPLNQSGWCGSHTWQTHSCVSCTYRHACLPNVRMLLVTWRVCKWTWLLFLLLHCHNASHTVSSRYRWDWEGRGEEW